LITVKNTSIYHHALEEESVVYDAETGNLFLIPFLNADILALMQRQTKHSDLISKMTKTFQIDRQQAKVYLDRLYLEYGQLNLLN